MLYNIYFDIATLVLLFIVITLCFYNRKFSGTVETTFFYFCASTLITTVIDIVSSVASSYPQNFSLLFQWIINILFYVSVCTMPVFYVVYVLAITGQFHKLKKPLYQVLVFLPYIIDLILVLLSPVLHIVFYIDEGNRYHRSAGIMILYALLFYAYVYSTVILTMNRNTVPKSKYWVTQSYVFFLLCGIILQFFYPFQLVENFCSSVSILIVFFALYSPGSKVDSASGIYNQHALTMFADHKFQYNESFSIITIIIDEIMLYSSTIGIPAVNELSHEIGIFLNSLAESDLSFYIRPGVYCFVIPPKKTAYVHDYIDIVRDRFNSPVSINGMSINIPVRQCVINCPDDAKNTEELFAVINTASENNIYKIDKLVYAKDIDTKEQFYHAYVGQLAHSAIQEKRFEVFYQPLYSVEKKKIIGAEALFRMKDDDGKYVDAETLAIVSEQNGAIIALGKKVFEDVCSFLALCRKEKINLDMVDVNLSVVQCMNISLADELAEISEKYGIDPEFIKLEITETAAAHKPEVLTKNMMNLMEKGFEFYLDDYGSGLANIEYLLQLPFSTVKIDKEILWNAMKDEKARILLISTIETMQRLNIKIVVEGIETQEMVDMLSSLGCNYLQGYYFSCPVPESDFFALLKKIQ